MTRKTPDAEAIRAHHEPLALNVRLLWLFLLGLAVLCAVGLGVSWGLNRILVQQIPEPERPFFPVDPPVEVDVFDLVPDQRTQRLLYEARQQALLESYGWTDEEGGIARIPIGTAMERVREQYADGQSN